MEAAPTCISSQRNHHQGATASALLKLQDWFSVDIDVVQTLSVLWEHTMTCDVHCASVYDCHSAHHRSYYAAIALTTSARRLYQH